MSLPFICESTTLWKREGVNASLRPSPNEESNISFIGNYSRTLPVKTSDRFTSQPEINSRADCRQYLAGPCGLAVTVLSSPPMYVQPQRLPAPLVPGDSVWPRTGSDDGGFQTNLRGSTATPTMAPSDHGDRVNIDGKPSKRLWVLTAKKRETARHTEDTLNQIYA